MSTWLQARGEGQRLDDPVGLGTLTAHVAANSYDGSMRVALFVSLVSELVAFAVLIGDRVRLRPFLQDRSTMTHLDGGDVNGHHEGLDMTDALSAVVDISATRWWIIVALAIGIVTGALAFWLE